MIDEEWLEKLEQAKEMTLSPVDFNDYFEKPEIAGKRLAVMNIGVCDLPSGEVLVRDPLVYLGSRKEKPYFQKVAAGSYQTEICVVDDSDDCARYAAVRVRFSDKQAVRFYEALVGNEDLSSLSEEDNYFGFNVDAGMACICDEIAHQAFCDWLEQWEKEHPDGNLYYDYFETLLGENCKKHPEHQRDCGDWLNWQIPGTQYHIPIFASGFGDGCYPVYWGVDADGEICQIIVQFIDIELAYGDNDADEQSE